MKPRIETMNTFLRPKRPASQPVIGVMIAAATIYEVSTQVIWSAEAETLPAMCGRATLAIVVSSEFITVASMIEAVIRPRLATPAAAPVIAAIPTAPLIDGGASARATVPSGQSRRTGCGDGWCRR